MLIHPFGGLRLKEMRRIMAQERVRINEETELFGKGNLQFLCS